MGLGRCYQSLGKLELALEHYDSALRGDGPKAYVFFSRGHCRSLLGDAAGAAADFEQVVLGLTPYSETRTPNPETRSSEPDARKGAVAGLRRGSSAVLPNTPKPTKETHLSWVFG